MTVGAGETRETETREQRKRQRERERANFVALLAKKQEDGEANGERGRQGDSFLESGWLRSFTSCRNPGSAERSLDFAHSSASTATRSARASESDRSELQEDRHLERRDVYAVLVHL